MKKALRWFGPETDPIPLEYIGQIPGVDSVVSTLYGKLPGEVWQPEEVTTLKNIVESADLELAGIESINVHDSIKAGGKDRDLYIDRYISSLEAVGRSGIGLVCYNFMPVFDWTRSDLEAPRADGSKVFRYDRAEIEGVDPLEIFSRLDSKSKGYTLPGWEKERIGELSSLFTLYGPIDSETLLENLVYFLKAIMPVCAKYDIMMAIHPDDPPWSVFGLPRIAHNSEQFRKIFNAVPDRQNGLTLCTGSLGADRDNDIPAMIDEFADRIGFAHIRNVKHIADRVFEESAHLSTDGSLDMFEIVNALYRSGFNGIIRPDHGREIWGEKSFPGYGLYDRALGISYIQGLLEGIEKSDRKPR